MVALGPSNVVARRAIDNIVEFTGETETSKYMKVNAMIAETEAMNDQEEYYDSLRSLRDSRRIRNDKVMGLNELIAQAGDDIWTNESHLEITEAVIKVGDKLNGGAKSSEDLSVERSLGVRMKAVGLVDDLELILSRERWKVQRKPLDNIREKYCS
ncbi:hypothetical protein Tco_0853970 [Tanacetum coccineum]